MQRCLSYWYYFYLTSSQCMLSPWPLLPTLHRKRQKWINATAVEQELLQCRAAVVSNSWSLNFISNRTIFIFNKLRWVQSGNKSKDRLQFAPVLTSCGKHVGMATLLAHLSLWSPRDTRRTSAVWVTDRTEWDRETFIMRCVSVFAQKWEQMYMKITALPREDSAFLDRLLKPPVGVTKEKVKYRFFIYILKSVKH